MSGAGALPDTATMSVTTVATASALMSALQSAQGGDVIRLQAGTYSGLSFYHQDFGSGVTITSADPLHPAVLTNFNMESVQGVAFSNVEFNVLMPNYVGFNVYSSQNISLDHVTMHGSLDGNSSNDAEGIR